LLYSMFIVCLSYIYSIFILYLWYVDVMVGVGDSCFYVFL
jgi:hypothetical protein